MIFGIGTDVVEVSRIHESIEKFGDTFARRILSDSEFEIIKQLEFPTITNNYKDEFEAYIRK